MIAAACVPLWPGGLFLSLPLFVRLSPERPVPTSSWLDKMLHLIDKSRFIKIFPKPVPAVAGVAVQLQGRIDRK
jgi:hypothetical protein